jgi:hypothetical protein
MYFVYLLHFCSTLGGIYTPHPPPPSSIGGGQGVGGSNTLYIIIIIIIIILYIYIRYLGRFDLLHLRFCNK